MKNANEINVKEVHSHWKTICSHNVLISLALYTLFTIHFFSFLITFLWDYSFTMPLITTAFVIFSGILFTSTYLTQTIPSADDAILAKAFKISPPEYGSKVSYCHSCKVDVHSSSRHCRHCDKCVLGFDHHCTWLAIPSSLFSFIYIEKLMTE